MTTTTTDERTIGGAIVEETAPLPARPLQPQANRQAAASPLAQGDIPLSYRHSEVFTDLMMALALAQGQFQDIEKNQTADVQTRREGARSYKYEYADLAAIMASVRPALSSNGIALLQMPSVRRGAVVVTTMICHGQSGQWFAVDLAVALENLDPQAVGSATTYARRYGVTSLLGLAAFDRDDDGAAAGVKPRQPVEAPPDYDERWLDLEAAAVEGPVALDQAWAGMTGPFKQFTNDHNRQKWTALKAKAREVKAS